MTLALVAHVVLSAAPAQLTVHVAPEGAKLFIDGKPVTAKGSSGAAASERGLVIMLKPGKHVLRVTYKGDAHTEDLRLKPGEKQTWKWSFEGTDAAPVEPGDTDVKLE